MVHLIGFARIWGSDAIHYYVFFILTLIKPRGKHKKICLALNCSEFGDFEKKIPLWISWKMHWLEIHGSHSTVTLQAYDDFIEYDGLL